MNLWNTYLEKCEDLVITTDLEGDDLIALWKLRERLRNKNLTFIVGEGKLPQIKYHRMGMYCTLLGFRNVKILIGDSSEKDFTYDGHELFTPELCEHLKTFPLKTSSQEIAKALSDVEVILSLKPPRDLMKLWKMAPEGFKDITLIGYMGFNNRTLFQEFGKEKVVDFYKSFKQVIYYETFFAIGENNTIKENEIDFTQFPSYILTLMKNWDRDIKEYCEKIVVETKDEHVKRRNQKIIDSINTGRQFVNADCGLAVTLLMDLKEEDYVKREFYFDENGYTKISEIPSDSIIIIAPKDKEGMRERQIKMFQ